VKEITQLLEKEGMQIGSRVWGGSTKQSDYDVVLLEKFGKEISKRINDSKDIISVERNNYEENRLKNKSSVKLFFKNGKIINILFYADYNCEKAKKAFDTITKISKKYDLSTKIIRHLVCEATIRRIFEEE